MGTTPPGPQYRLALARIASFIGALQQVRRVDPVRDADDVALAENIIRPGGSRGGNLGAD
jgi:hypothetical protein